MTENQDEGKVVGNFRAGVTSFLSVICIALLQLLFDGEEGKKLLIEQCKLISPVFAGGVAYTLSIPFTILVSRLDVRRYQNQIDLLKTERSELDTLVDVEQVEQIDKDISAYKRRIFEINSKSLFS